MATPNMGLTLPSIGITPAPTYGTQQNNDLTLIDQHDHTPGKGVVLTADSININSDFTLNSNNLIDVRSVRFTAQGSPISDPTDIGCIYVAGVDLYYNDGNGNQVQITNLGSVAGASGSIAGLVSPASASYTPMDSTFTWQSDINTPAIMDQGPTIIRELVAAGEGVTLQAPAGLAASYDLVLPPSLPANNSVLTVDASGNVTTSIPHEVDSTLGFFTVNGDFQTTNGDVTAGGNVAATGNVTSNGDMIAQGNVIGATVFPGGPSNARFEGVSAKTINIHNASVSASYPIATSNSFTPPFIIAGAFNQTSSAILAGGGFSISKLSSTQSQVTFTTLEAGIGYSATATGDAGVCVVQSKTSTSFIIDNFSGNVVVNFIVVGQRDV